MLFDAPFLTEMLGLECFILEFAPRVLTVVYLLSTNCYQQGLILLSPIEFEIEVLQHLFILSCVHRWSCSCWKGDLGERVKEDQTRPCFQ